MKKLGTYVIAIFFIIGIILILESEGVNSYAASKGSQQGDEKTLFQIASDTMSGPSEISKKDRVKPINEINIFQNMSDAIKDSSKKARNQSLRGSKKK